MTVRAYPATVLLGSRFLRAEDYTLSDVRALREMFGSIYRGRYHGRPHYAGARRPDDVTIHWSRDWEYPWIALNYDTWRRHVARASGIRILDLGCGGSPLPAFFAEQTEVAAVVGIDRADLFLGDDHSSTLRRIGRGISFPPKLAYCRADFVGLLPIRSGTIDVVTCVSVLEECPEAWPSVFAEIERVLSPGGVALLTVDVGRRGTGDISEAITPVLSRRLDMGALTPLALPAQSGIDPLVPNDPAQLPGEYQVLGLFMRKEP